MQDDTEVKESNIIEAYRATLSLWIQTEANITSHLNWMTLVHSILILGIIQVEDSGGLSTYLPILLSSIGMLLCAVWWRVMKRSFACKHIFIELAKTLEENLNRHSLDEGLRNFPAHQLNYDSGEIETLSKKQRIIEGEGICWATKCITASFCSLYIIVFSYECMNYIR